MKTRFHVGTQRIVRWSLTLLGAGWIFCAAWFLFQPTPTYGNYGRQMLASCRNLPTSDSRYQCTSQLMLAKDNVVFNKTLIILLPPLFLLIGYVGVTKIITAQRDKRKSHAAIAASHQRMAEWRRHLNDIKAAAAASSANGTLTPIAVRSASAIRPHPARRQ
jgi:hypothetical protein